MNIGVYNSPQPDRWPLNAHSTMVTNILATYGLYLPPIFFPDQIWLALGPIFLGFGQILIHGININSKMHSYYNPGLASAILMHVPGGIAYMRHVNSTGRPTALQYGLGLAYGVAISYLLLAKYTFTWAPDPATPYHFTTEEMQRGGVAAWLARA